MTVRALPDLRNVKRLLIIRLSAIGDVIHALPVSAALGEAYPHLEITWVVEEISAEVVRGNPYLKDVIVIPRKRWNQGRLRSPRVWREYAAFLGELRRRRFDVTLDLQGYGKTALVALATGAPYRLGWSRLRDGAGLVSRALPRRPESAHRVDWFLDVVRALGVPVEKVRFPLHIPEEAHRRAAELLQAGGLNPDAGYVVINPAAGDHSRRWKPERYGQVAAELARQYGLTSVLVGIGKDQIVCEAIRAEAQEHLARSGVPADKMRLPLNLAGQTNLKELAAVISRCRMHISGDTGSAHIAVALDRPVIALYGGTDPDQVGPWGQRENVLSHRELCHAACTVRRCHFVTQDVPSEAALEARLLHADEAERAAAHRQAMERAEMARCLAAITPEAVLERAAVLLADGC